MCMDASQRMGHILNMRLVADNKEQREMDNVKLLKYSFKIALPGWFYAKNMLYVIILITLL